MFISIKPSFKVTFLFSSLKILKLRSVKALIKLGVERWAYGVLGSNTKPESAYLSLSSYSLRPILKGSSLGYTASS